MRTLRQNRRESGNVVLGVAVITSLFMAGLYGVQMASSLRVSNALITRERLLAFPMSESFATTIIENELIAVGGINTRAPAAFKNSAADPSTAPSIYVPFPQLPKGTPIPITDTRKMVDSTQLVEKYVDSGEKTGSWRIERASSTENYHCGSLRFGKRNYQDCMTGGTVADLACSPARVTPPAPTTASSPSAKIDLDSGSYGVVKITTRADLTAINGVKFKKFELQNDIDLGPGGAWTPVILDNSTFDGKNYTIKNMVINDANLVAEGAIPGGGVQYTGGLFSKVKSFSRVRSLNLQTVTMKGLLKTSKDRIYAGALVGWLQESEVDSVKATIGTLEVTNTNSSYVGGLVGYQAVSGIPLARSEIRNSTVDQVNVSGAWAGGLAGYFQDGLISKSTTTNGTVKGAFATGPVAGGLISKASNMFLDQSSSSMAVQFDSANKLILSSVCGGLLGVYFPQIKISSSWSKSNIDCQIAGGIAGTFGKGEIVSSYHSTGTIKGKTRAGGLVGTLESQGVIRKSYSSTTLEATTWAGGLVGEANVNNVASFTLIQDSFARTTVAAKGTGGNIAAGGIIAYVGNSPGRYCVQRAYYSGALSTPNAVAPVPANKYYAGLVGAVTRPSAPPMPLVFVKSTYWDSETTGTTVGAWNVKMSDGSYASATFVLDPKNTTPMKLQETYLGWDYSGTGTWQIASSKYPWIQGLPEP